LQHYKTIRFKIKLYVMVYNFTVKHTAVIGTKYVLITAFLIRPSLERLDFNVLVTYNTFI